MILADMNFLPLKNYKLCLNSFIYFCVLILPINIISSHSAKAKVSISIVNDTANTLKKELLSQTTELFSMELTKFESTEVISPSELKSALNRAALGQLLGCDELECYFNYKSLLKSDYLRTIKLKK